MLGNKGTKGTKHLWEVNIYAHNGNVHVPVCYCVIRVNIKPDQTRPAAGAANARADAAARAAVSAFVVVVVCAI